MNDYIPEQSGEPQFDIQRNQVLQNLKRLLELDSKVQPQDEHRNVNLGTDLDQAVSMLLKFKLKPEELKAIPTDNVLFLCVGNSHGEMGFYHSFIAPLAVGKEKPNVTIVDKQISSATENDWKQLLETKDPNSLRVYDKSRVGDNFGLIHFFQQAIENQEQYGVIVMFGAEYLLYENQELMQQFPEIMSLITEPNGVCVMSPYPTNSLYHIKSWENSGFSTVGKPDGTSMLLKKNA